MVKCYFLPLVDPITPETRDPSCIAASSTSISSIQRTGISAKGK